MRRCIASIVVAIVLTSALVSKLSLYSHYIEVTELHGFSQEWKQARAATVSSNPLVVEPNINTTNANKPLFVLHVGPPKTGTTSIQWIASRFGEELLPRNNLYFLGHNPRGRNDLHKLYETCVDATQQEECQQQWKAFDQVIHHHYQQGHNVFVSDELFAKSPKEKQLQVTWDHLVALQEKWNVRVVFTYRRYYEWLVSSYHQTNNPNLHSDKYLKWPGLGGKETVPFVDYLDVLLKKNGTTKNRNPMHWKKSFHDDFSNVVTFNMHGVSAKENFVRDFYCNTIPEAVELCRFLRVAQVSNQLNPSSEKLLHFDMIATGAFKREWINRDLPRPAVAQAVQYYSEKELKLTKMTDFELVCPSSDSTEKLFEMSLSMEQAMVPEFYRSPKGGEESMRIEFDKFVQEKRFCSVEVEKTLNQEQWQTFFRTRMAFAQ